ncbi:MAG: WecB/TagA/CpsF family glycosyltransferase, partial [bacterium]|nr:WecB/TagA/CpsF family glycosyltransferase [bacterium]
SGTGVIFVALGMGKQEKWIIGHKNELEELGVKVAMGVGGSFDYLAGSQKRAPVLVQKAGLEWLWRLILEPKRWRRQLALVRFGLAVLRKRSL